MATIEIKAKNRKFSVTTNETDGKILIQSASDIIVDEQLAADNVITERLTTAPLAGLRIWNKTTTGRFTIQSVDEL